MFDRDENRYHGYPSLKDIAKVLIVETIKLPYTLPKYLIKKGLKKLKGNDAK
jgi:hypothetical protein